MLRLFTRNIFRTTLYSTRNFIFTGINRNVSTVASCLLNIPNRTYSTINCENNGINKRSNNTGNTNNRANTDSSYSQDEEFKLPLVQLGLVGGCGLMAIGYCISGIVNPQDDTMPLDHVPSMSVLDRISQYIMEHIDAMFPGDGAPLLPDFKELNYPPNLPTLVIDLDKVIAKLEYDRKVGWQVKKRPFADKFFKELVNYYELVIWSDDSYPMATDVANRWGLPVVGVLHRDQCKAFKGSFIKDLSRLGRDLKRVILLDHDKTACLLQENNAIIIREFDGDEQDRELLYLIDMLKMIALNSQDVTIQIKQLGGGNDYDIGRRFSEKISLDQERAKARMNISRKLGFKHF